MTVDIVGIAGLSIVTRYVGLPVGCKSHSVGHEIESLKRLVLSGDEHAKLMRMVHAWFDIRAPRYWWQQFATYRIGVESYSESTMHTLTQGVNDDDFIIGTHAIAIRMLKRAIDRGDFTGAKASLPEGHLQRRLVMISYQTLRRIFLQRRYHKLREWQIFIDALRNLPRSDKLIFCGTQFNDYFLYVPPNETSEPEVDDDTE